MRIEGMRLVYSWSPAQQRNFCAGSIQWAKHGPALSGRWPHFSWTEHLCNEGGDHMFCIIKVRWDPPGDYYHSLDITVDSYTGVHTVIDMLESKGRMPCHWCGTPSFLGQCAVCSNSTLQETA